MTIHDRLVAALQKLGEHVLANKTRKYTTMSRAGGNYYYIGKAGALRTGRTVSNSRPVSETVKRLLLDSVTK